MEETPHYEYVNHPSHYNKYSEEAYKMIELIFYPNDPAGMAKFAEATAMLYRLRLGLKPENSVEQELNKESWWLQKRDEYIKRLSK